MAKAAKISQEEYVRYKHLADKVMSQKTRALTTWYNKYEEYYDGERELLMRQYRTELHQWYNGVLDKLQAMLIGVEI